VQRANGRNSTRIPPVTCEQQVFSATSAFSARFAVKSFLTVRIVKSIRGRREDHPSVMRVIAGKYRSRPLRSLRGMDIRPTSDRLRETLFNVLTAGGPGALVGSIWVDLFAGTGAVGIEALSRGAAQVYFVESSKPAAEVIQENLRSLGIADGFEILRLDSGRGISYVERRNAQPHYIFLDPPYAMRDAYRQTLDTLARSAIGTNAVVIAEHEKRLDPGEKFGRLMRFRQLLQGDAGLTFYRAP